MRAVWNKQTSERCKKISKWTSKWRSTHVLISKTSESLYPLPPPATPFSATPHRQPLPSRPILCVVFLLNDVRLSISQKRSRVSGGDKRGNANSIQSNPYKWVQNRRAAESGKANAFSPETETQMDSGASQQTSEEKPYVSSTLLHYFWLCSEKTFYQWVNAVMKLY